MSMNDWTIIEASQGSNRSIHDPFAWIVFHYQAITLPNVDHLLKPMRSSGSKDLLFS